MTTARLSPSLTSATTCIHDRHSLWQPPRGDVRDSQTGYICLHPIDDQDLSVVVIVTTVSERDHTWMPWLHTDHLPGEVGQAKQTGKSKAEPGGERQDALEGCLREVKRLDGMGRRCR